MTQKPQGKGSEFLKAMGDLVILGLMLTGAGFGGYFWGIHQRLAPVKEVAPGTPGAIVPAESTTSTTASAPIDDSQAANASPAAHPAVAGGAKTGKHKYWLSSSGTKDVGSNITVKVNGDTVDNFFAPGKNVDVSSLIKKGDNTVEFDATQLSEGYNKHQDDATAVLKVQVVTGPYVQENFKDSDVLAKYSRSAVDSGEDSKTFHVTGL